MLANIYIMKRLVDIDDEALAAAQLALGTRTMKDTVNQALLAVAKSSARSESIDAALATLAAVEFTDVDRIDAWR